MSGINGFKTLRVGMDVREVKQVIEPKLLSRKWYTDAGAAGSFVIAAPNKARFVIFRAIGSGESVNLRGKGGMGGDYVRLNYTCVPGEPFNIRVSPNASADAAVYKTIDPILRAKGGGSLSVSFGDTVRPGQAPTYPLVAGAEGATVRGGRAGEDLEDPDTLFLFGNGAYDDIQNVALRPTGYGGGSAFSNISGRSLIAPGGGVVVVEFYTADPR